MFTRKRMLRCKRLRTYVGLRSRGMDGGRYDAEADDEVTLVPFQLVIHQPWAKCEDGWMSVETLQGAQGMVPESYLVPLPSW